MVEMTINVKQMEPMSVQFGLWHMQKRRKEPPGKGSAQTNQRMSRTALCI